VLCWLCTCIYRAMREKLSACSGRRECCVAQGVWTLHFDKPVKLPAPYMWACCCAVATVRVCRCKATSDPVFCSKMILTCGDRVHVVLLLLLLGARGGRP
jgi:hypothetical protein